MSRLVDHDDRTLFEKAWLQGIASGVIDSEVSERVARDGAKAIRQFASILGSDHLRIDLERAMRSMLALINLNLEYETGHDVGKAARSIAVNGIGHHTREAARHMKAAGYDVRGIVTDRAFMDFHSYQSMIGESEKSVKRLEAAQWALAAIGYTESVDSVHASLAMRTALLFMIFKPKTQWSGDMAGFETMLKAVRAKAKIKKVTVPKVVPEAFKLLVQEECDLLDKKILEMILDENVEVHQLSSSHDLAALILTPGAAAYAESAEELYTSHWLKLSAGTYDEDVLVSLMLSGVFFEKSKRSLTVTEAKLIAEKLNEPPAKSGITAWLEMNAPHALQEGLLDLWQSFWEEANASYFGSQADRLEYVKAASRVGRKRQ